MIDVEEIEKLAAQLEAAGDTCEVTGAVGAAIEQSVNVTTQKAIAMAALAMKKSNVKAGYNAGLIYVAACAVHGALGPLAFCLMNSETRAKKKLTHDALLFAALFAAESETDSDEAAAGKKGFDPMTTALEKFKAVTGREFKDHMPFGPDNISPTHPTPQ